MAADCIAMRDKGKDRKAQIRQTCFAERLDASRKKLNLSYGLSAKTIGRFGLQRIARQLDGRVTTDFRDTTPLKAILALVEVLTVQPYAAGGKDAAKQELGQRPRLAVMTRIASAARIPVQSNSNVLEVVRVGLKAAEQSHSDVFTKAFIVLGASALAIVAGIFAGPLVGGLIGTYLLGLSGAAAVSAGLALLGGGALAAGGFGMIGGTVVIASAFGVAGAGASGMFLGKHGEIGAQLSVVKQQAIFHALVELGLMDHKLASDFIDALESQHTEYERIGQGWDKRAKQARKVAKVMVRALDWTRDCYGEATRLRKVRHSPIAWRVEETATDKKALTDSVQDQDFKGLMRAMARRRQKLEICLEYLRHAHLRYAQVKDANFIKGLKSHLDKSARRRLMHGDAYLHIVLEEVMVLLFRHQEEAENLARAIKKVSVLNSEIARRDSVIERYQVLTTKIHLAYQKLKAENAELRERLERRTRKMDEMLAIAMLWAGLHRLTSGRPPHLLATNRRSSGSSPPSDQDLANPRLDLCIAVSMGSGIANLPQVLEPALARGIDIPSTEEMGRVLDAIGMPLGAPMAEVRKRYRQRAAEAHPDKHIAASEPLVKVLREQFDRVQLAYAIHQRYAALTDEGRT